MFVRREVDKRVPRQPPINVEGRMRGEPPLGSHLDKWQSGRRKAYEKAQATGSMDLRAAGHTKSLWRVSEVTNRNGGSRSLRGSVQFEP